MDRLAEGGFCPRGFGRGGCDFRPAAPGHDVDRVVEQDDADADGDFNGGDFLERLSEAHVVVRCLEGNDAGHYFTGDDGGKVADDCEKGVESFGLV